MTDMERIELAARRTEARIRKEHHFAVAREHADAFRIFGEEILRLIRDGALPNGERP